MSGYFITGTDTGVGKTIACAYLMHALGADYWKPVQSGLDGETDTMVMRRLTDMSAERFHVEAYSLRAPLSPHESARREGIVISLDAFQLPSTPRSLIVEGAGGVLVPLNGDALMVDLIKQIGLPVVLVARTMLGTINHTLLSLEALRARQLDVAGVILNGPRDDANRAAIEQFGRVRILAELPQFASLDAQSLGRFAGANPPRLSATA